MKLIIVLVLLLLVFCPAFGQNSGCDLNNDGSVNVVDVQLSVNMALGKTACTATIRSGACDIVVVQRVVNALLGQSCISDAVAHTVTLAWTASVTPSVSYNVYRGVASGGPYSKITSTLISGTTYVDTSVTVGAIYYYVATAVDLTGNESIYSNQAQASIPNP